MLILASSSQSRKNLLKNSDIQFIQIKSSFDESSVVNNNIKDLTIELSNHKAKSVIKKMEEMNLKNNMNCSSFQILGCDSIFEFNGKAYGKPSNKEEAYNRWLEMSSSSGFLHTGHSLLFIKLQKENNNLILKKEIKKVVSSKIFFSQLKEEEIKEYVNSLEPMYCAGGFALEGRGGKYIERIEGCFSNVMGLSLPWLRKELLLEGIYS